jgi:AraC family transcriptional regulator of arabinose operon
MFTLTVGGCGRFVAAGAEVVAAPGDLVAVPPFVPHDYAVREGRARWEFLWAHAVVRSEWDPLLDDSGIQRTSVPGSHFPAVLEAFTEALTHRRTDRPVADRLAMNCLERALLLVADARQVPEGVTPVVARVLEHVETHLADDLSVRTLARRAQMSVSRFAHVFTAQVGTPPHRYVERRRLDLAARLLEETTRPVSDVAGTVGFTDPLYFSRRFRGAHGCSPTAFRERAGHGRSPR